MMQIHVFVQIVGPLESVVNHAQITTQPPSSLCLPPHDSQQSLAGEETSIQKVFGNAYIKKTCSPLYNHFYFMFNCISVDASQNFP